MHDVKCDSVARAVAERDVVGGGSQRVSLCRDANECQHSTSERQINEREREIDSKKHPAADSKRERLVFAIRCRVD